MAMNRYQIYLDPQSVLIFDQAALSLNVTRSHVIRDVLDRVALEFKKALTVRYGGSKKSPLMQMNGMFMGASPNLSEDVDSIYG